MEKELKETLLKIADYDKLQKQKTVKRFNILFGIMFVTCIAAIIIQVILTGNLSLIIGEIIIMLVGGFGYLHFIVRK